MVWRIIHPISDGLSDHQVNLLAERAYIVVPIGAADRDDGDDACGNVFGHGHSGLSGQLNVFAGVLTEDIYRPIVGPNRSEQHFLWVGRLFTLLLGGVVIGVALMISGAEAIVIAITSLACGTLLALMLWGLFSRKIGTAALWITAAGCLPLIALIKMEWIKPGAICNALGLTRFASWFAGEVLCSRYYVKLHATGGNFV